MRRIIILSLLFFASLAWAQTPVLLTSGTTTPFLTTGGQVCSGCFLYTYTSGSFTLLSTFTDYTGLFANTNPIQLNSSGYAQTSSGSQVGVWLSATATYRLVLKNAANVQIWQIDGVTGQLPGSISTPVSILTSACNQLAIGVIGFQTGLCFPSPASNITLTFPNATSDTMVARNTTDTLTNKTLTSPSMTNPTVNNCQVVGPPATYLCLPNAGSGTTNDALVIMNGSNQVTKAPAGTTSGILGMCLSGCGNSGTAVIQSSGVVICGFDNSTTAGDYITPSTVTAGACHDNGVVLPSGTQNLGIVVTTGPGSAQTIVLAGGAAPLQTGAVSKQTQLGNNLSITSTGIQSVPLVTPASNTALVVGLSIWNTTAGVGCGANGTYTTYIAWTDATSGNTFTAVTSSLTGTASINTPTYVTLPINAKAGTTVVVGINVTAAATGCSTNPVAAYQATGLF